MYDRPKQNFVKSWFYFCFVHFKIQGPKLGFRRFLSATLKITIGYAVWDTKSVV